MPRIRAESIAAHKELTRVDVLDAAHELLEEVGSADISLAEVAHQAGIGRTTLYEYFRDKDDLIASLVEERLPDVVDGLLADIDAEGDVSRRLAALAVATVRFVVADPVLGLILHRELPRLSAEAQERIRDAHGSLSRQMIEAYRTGVEKGVFRPVPPDIAGRLIHDTIMSAARVLIAADDPRSRIDEVEREMTAFLLGGLATA